MTILQATHITKSFGGLTAVDDVSVYAERGRIDLLMGPNGAGKTTFFNVISGVDRPDGGTVEIEDREMTGRSAHEFARAGLMRTFQHARPFGGLSVIENVMVGAHVRSSAGLLRGTLRTPGARHEERRLRERAGRLLNDVGLADAADRPAAELSLAEERRLELARCLAGDPRVVLLDEPMAGLGEDEADELAALVRNVAEEGDVAVVLIEHHLELALGLADHVTVLNFGRTIASGPPDEVRDDPDVVAAYVGKED